jgi:hypothetical protein
MKSAAVPVTVDMPKAKPAPGAKPAAGATTATAAAPKPAVKPAPVVDGNSLLLISTMDAVKAFVDRGLAPYVQAWTKVTVLPSHLTVPQAQAILTAE